MSDQTSIFNSNQNPGETPPNNAPGNGANGLQDELATLLTSIKNERGEPKYKTVQDALNALKHSQDYIPQLKDKEQELQRKLDEALQKVSKLDTLEQTVLELTQKVSTSPQNPTAGLTEEQVAELVTRTLTRTQLASLQQTNLETVANTVKAKFGDKAEQVFYDKAKELGMSVAEFNALAAKTPKAVLKLVGIDDSQQRQSTIPVNFNTDGFQPQPNSQLGRNTKPAIIGATSQDLREESANAAAMVEELAGMGMSVHDLTDPKVYNKFFKAR